MKDLFSIRSTFFRLKSLEFEIREFKKSDLDPLTSMLNSSYKELADRGLNYTASYQDSKARKKI
jgi:hypothetical protein